MNLNGKNSIGFTTDGDQTICYCGKTFATPQLAKKHEIAEGNCHVWRTHPNGYYCAVCDHQTYSIAERDKHLASKAHRNNVDPVNLTCDACNVVCRTPKEYERHCAGKHHLYKINPTLRPSYACECCKITCLSAKQLEAHNETNKHKKNAPPS